MITLHGGPVAGTYTVKRAPRYLRGVIDQDGKLDVLDMILDNPKDTECIYVYKRIVYRGMVHINSRNGSGFYASADYAWLPYIDGEKFRERAAWEAWCIARQKIDDRREHAPKLERGRLP